MQWNKTLSIIELFEELPFFEKAEWATDVEWQLQYDANTGCEAAEFNEDLTEEQLAIIADMDVVED